ncbi:MAG: hypothetical protein LBH06_07645, partial [Rikenellaceae bacterium]|nr:hypothetical protein [Rikenellaceae bacterium]
MRNERIHSRLLPRGFIDSDTIIAGVRSGYFADETNRVITLGGGNAEELAIGDTVVLQAYFLGAMVDNSKFNPRMEVYNRILDAIGDHGYNKHVIALAEPMAITAVIDAIRTISITTDRDYDAAHPAGSDLGDCFT